MSINLYSEYRKDEPNNSRIVKSVSSEVAKRRFLELFSETANIEKACKILGMVRRTVYAWKYNDPEFAAKFAEADELALQVLEDEANRRALYGVEKPVYQGGKLAGHVTEYSDTLLIVLLKARAPHKYKERFSGEITGADGKPLMPENRIVHVHSPVPIAEGEEQIDQTIYLPDSASKPYVAPAPLSDKEQYDLNFKQQPVEDELQKLLDEDLDLLGEFP